MVGFNQQQLLSFVTFKLFYFWPMNVSLCWLLDPFETNLVVFYSFLTFWYDDMFQAHLVQFHTWNQVFLKKPWFPLVRNCILGSLAGWVHLVMGVSDRARTNRDLMNSNDNSNSVFLFYSPTTFLCYTYSILKILILKTQGIIELKYPIMTHLLWSILYV